MFKVLKSGKRQKKSWKRMITKVTFVGQGFTRKPPKYERFIRPTGLRMTKAHVTHPELKATFCLDIIGIKKNPNGQMYTTLGVITKGTIIEVNVSELGLVTPGGKVVWGKYAQVRWRRGGRVLSCMRHSAARVWVSYLSATRAEAWCWRPSLECC